jgi:glycosyltransferase involved in cell wall biosynthesis
LRIGIVTDGLEEREIDGRIEIANGGVGVYIYHLIEQLHALNTAHELFPIRYGVGRLDVYRTAPSRNIFLRHTRLSRRANQLDPPYWRLFDLPYWRVSRARGLDVIHYPNQLGGAWLPKRIPRVITVHDITPFLFPDLHPDTRVQQNHLLMGRSLSAADHIIAVSEQTRRDVLANFRVAAARVSVVPQGVAPDFRPTPHTPNFLTRYDLPGPFLLSVGVLEPRKNHGLVVETLRRLHAEGERLGVVIVGRQGWNWTDPRDDPRLADLRPWVRVVCDVPTPDLIELYNRAEALVYASRYEGFGLPILEALACGTPVVAVETPVLFEVAGTAALVARPGSAENLAQQCLLLRRNPNLRRERIAAGLQRAREFSWRQTAEQTLAIYAHVARQHSHNHPRPKERDHETKNAAV